MSETWAAVLKPHIDRFDIGAKFDQVVSFNATGCEAMATLLRGMAQKLDAEFPALLATARAEARKAALEEAAAVFEVYASDQRASIAEGRVTGIGVNNAEVRAETWEEAAWQLRKAAAYPAIRALIEHESKEG